MIAHALAYPLGVLAALASMPPAIIVRKRALLAAGPEDATHPLIRDVARDLSLTAVEAAQVQLVLEVVLGAALVVLVLVHVAAVPWALAETRGDSGSAASRRGRRVFVYSLGALVIGLVLLAAAGWSWLLLAPVS